jgi:hypothetical protein
MIGRQDAYVCGGTPVRRWLLGPVLALSISLVMPSTARAQSGGVGVLSTDAFTNFADPCFMVRMNLRRIGIPTVTSDPVVRATMQKAWAVLLPVLVQIADEPALADDPETLADRIGEHLRTARLYSPDQGRQAIQIIEAAAMRGRAALQNGEPVESGLILLAAIRSDPDMWAAWQIAASMGQWLGNEMGDLMLRGYYSRGGSWANGAALVQCSGR